MQVAETASTDVSHSSRP